MHPSGILIISLFLFLSLAFAYYDSPDSLYARFAEAEADYSGYSGDFDLLYTRDAVLSYLYERNAEPEAEAYYDSYSDDFGILSARDELVSYLYERSAEASGATITEGLERAWYDIKGKVLPDVAPEAKALEEKGAGEVKGLLGETEKEGASAAKGAAEGERAAGEAKGVGEDASPKAGSGGGPAAAAPDGHSVDSGDVRAKTKQVGANECRVHCRCNKAGEYTCPAFGIWSAAVATEKCKHKATCY